MKIFVEKYQERKDQIKDATGGKAGGKHLQ